MQRKASAMVQRTDQSGEVTAGGSRWDVAERSAENNAAGLPVITAVCYFQLFSIQIACNFIFPGVVRSTNYDQE